VGDLGNILVVNEKVSVSITDPQVMLYGEQSVADRSIVIHSGEDDLGKGGDDGSLKTGNAGSRVACGKIILKKAQKETKV